MASFQREREEFQKFKACFQPNIVLQEEFLNAVRALYARYDTAIRENRFVVGGALEIILGSVMRACHLPIRHRGTETREWDLLFVDGQGGYSIKSLLKPRTRGTRLVNVLGRDVSPNLWQVATLFLLPQGMVYADPALPWWQQRLHDTSVFKVHRDALEVKRRAIEAFAQAAPQWFLPWRQAINVPAMQPRRWVRTASYDVATTILKDESPRLFQFLPSLIPPAP
ncbi:MAG: hypothetical protein GXO54_00015 [Chloroflexi bacterium]|nr:hypothetical protein [Chloroflexota bacterium]